jgi:Flp pilus assembly protein TadG
MSNRNQKRRTSQRGATLLLGSMCLVFIVPMMGLAVDLGFLYSIKSKLQAAADGSSLAAARALNLGQSTASQMASAQNHAVNWFYANFPSSYLDTTNTVMTTSNVQVYDDANNPNLHHVTVNSTTTVKGIFMKWFGFPDTTITAVSDATRRDAVIMMVLDRSGSMGTSCTDLRAAAKLFTGQFAGGRDYIGMVSFADGTVVNSAPTRNFLTVLGYTNDFGSANGAIDTINCNGGTGTAQAISLAFNELVKTNLPGGFNLIMFETDGLPNTLTMDWWDSTNTVAGLANSSTCTDNNNKLMSQGGFQTVASLNHNWAAGYNTGTSAYYPNIPDDHLIGALYSQDPGSAASFIVMFNPWQTSSSGSNNSSYISPNGCAFSSNHSSYADLAWAPMTDVFGNQLSPATDAYQGSLTLTGSGTVWHVSLAGGTSTAWTNYHAGVLNATDDAARTARKFQNNNGGFPVYFFVIGLGGNGGLDHTLLQRIANDPNGDLYNTPVAYYPCAQTASCVNYPASVQPQGTYIYSKDRTKLTQAFLAISSQILRLSK